MFQSESIHLLSLKIYFEFHSGKNYTQTEKVTKHLRYVPMYYKSD